MAAPMSRLRVVEFYSGIGGMHYAVKESHLDHASVISVVAAIDINDLANKVYKHNFPNVNLMQRNIQSITLEEFNEWDADIFLMSPPCQPFTRVGLKGDINDPRTQSFFHLLEMLPRLAKLPNYILVENVQGFETSHTRNHLVQTLAQCKYTYQEFLLSPTHFGIPNQRLRYFLLAKRRPLVFNPVNISQLEHQSLQKQQLKTCDPVSDFGSKSPEEGTNERFAATSNSDSHLEVDERERKHCRCCDIVDTGSKTHTCKYEAQESEISGHHEGSCSSEITNRRVPSSPQTGPVSGLLRAEAVCEESTSSCKEAVSEDISGHEGSRSDTISNSKEDSSAGVVAVSTRPSTEDCQEDVGLSSCECVSERQADRGSSDEIAQCTTDRGSLAAQACLLTLQPKECDEPSSQRTNDEKEFSCKIVGDYVENLPAEVVEQLLLPDRLLKRFARIVDVVTATDCRTRCFTKAYGRYVEGTGSMLQMNTTTKGTSLLKHCQKDIERITEKYLDQLKCLRIRYFTPREITNLHHFPEAFVFPAELTRKQRYRCLGNSLNVHVVAVLLRYMVTERAR
ncbi:tRNA (cytosine(38)-C(5))-methyltransferase-like [Patiria miniata]|uniref:tRNA (cytosine(38)-C(5))-methyltransferase n=1 Tax=Patiria miniata TaxID=46514 RepID=A0A913ZMS5_PATMI|nr:tRNA (cytosine(38)-C(5))-methyltransferase-like [Patiria miniata]